MRLTRFPSGTVRPGDVIELAWSRPAGAVEELEIVLSLDGGQRYSMRVSPELDRARAHYTWTVPALATAHARLSVRYGEERDEHLSTPTPEFVIAATPASGTAPAVRSAWVTHPDNAMNWWDESDAAPAAAPGPSLRGDATLARGPGATIAGLLPRRAPPTAFATATFEVACLDHPGVVVAYAAAPVSTVPLSTPKRE